MRKIFLMRGAPAVGKSTFLAAYPHNTLGYDQAREMVSGLYPTLDGDVAGFSRTVGQDADKLVTTFVQNAAALRMSRGETLFIDNTFARLSEVSAWVKMARPYLYEVIVVDCQSGVSLDEALARDAARDAEKVVGETVLRSMYEKIEEASVPASVARTITPEQVEAELTVPIADFTDRERVIVIGDVQGCNTALTALLDMVQPTAADQVIFAGDLFDRGVENAEVYRTVTELRAQVPTTFVMGNHDHHIIECVNQTAPGRFKDTRESLRQMVDAGIMSGEARDLCADFVPFVYADFGAEFGAYGARLLVTHGGVDTDLTEFVVGDSVRTGLLPDRFFEMGTGRREKTYRASGDYECDIDAVFGEKFPSGRVLAFHGHRNTPVTSGNGVSFGLESKVEFDGGVLTAAVITREADGAVSVARVTVENTVTCGPERTQADRDKAGKRARKDGGRALLAELRASDLVKEKVIEDTGLSAFNFTRDAFIGAQWDEMSTTARGLFLDSETGVVAGRGYSKFFNVGERTETTVDAVIDRFGDGGVVRVEHKLNGYLGVAFVHNGVLRCWSKSGPSPFAAEFERLLAEHLRDRLSAFTEALGKSNVSLTFEVLSPTDPHIVSDGHGVVLLHAVANTTNRLILLDDVADRFAADFNLDRATAATGHGVEFVRAILDDASAAATEGVVLRHLPSGAMVKVKSDSYSAWKSLRVPLNRLVNLSAHDYSNAVHDLRSRRSERDSAITAVLLALTEVTGNSRPLSLFTVASPLGQRTTLTMMDLPAVRDAVGDDVLGGYIAEVARSIAERGVTDSDEDY